MLCTCLRIVCFTLMCASLLNGANAQKSSTTDEVLAMIPPDAIGLVTVRPRLIAQDEALKMFPLEIVSASGLENLGFDPLKIERIDAIVGLPGIVGPQVAAVVRYDENIPADIRKLFAQVPEKKQGLELWPLKDAPGWVYCAKGPRLGVIGTEAYVLRLLKSKPVDGELRQLAGGMSEPGQLSIVVALEPMRDMLVGLAQTPQLQQLPQFGPDVATLAAKTRMIALRAQFGAKPLTAIALEAANEADAAALDEALTRLSDAVAKTLIAETERQSAQEPGRIADATVAYVNRLTGELKRQFKFERSGERLMLKLEGNQLGIGQYGIMTGMLLPAVQSARDAARRMQSHNNQKQILLALHNYESVYKTLPSDTDISKDGKAGDTSNLSWRVKLLPFLEQEALYKEFHRDEPWDSPHNIKLLERMPEVYKHPQSAGRPGYTCYQMPTGQHLAAEPGTLLSFVGSFPDGLSNTIGLVETRDEAAVPWTKPGDFDPLEHPENLRAYRDLFFVAMMDGSVRQLSVNIKPAELRALFTRDGND